MRRWKQRIELKTKEERQIVRTLSALPRMAPEIKIDLVDGEDREIAFDPIDECSLPPVVGAQGFYADYDAVTHEILEATFVWNRSGTRVNHISCIDRYTAGGGWDNGRFEIYWGSPALLHFNPASVHVLDEDTGKVNSLWERLVTTGKGVNWIDSEHCTGPENGGVLLSGNAIVHIDDKSFDCIRALQLYQEEHDTDNQPEPNEPLMQFSILDDTYLTLDGRALLHRRYMSHECYTWDIWSTNRFTKQPAQDNWPEWSTGRHKIVYNGIEFRHWFDILTDVSLGWPVSPPFRARSCSRKSRALFGARG